MRDAAGQLADRFHPLHLRQLRFGGAGARDVARDAEDQLALARQTPAGIDRLAIAPAHLALELDIGLAAGKLHHIGLVGLREIVADMALAIGGHRAESLFPSRVARHQHAFGGGDQHHVERRIPQPVALVCGEIGCELLVDQLSAQLEQRRYLAGERGELLGTLEASRGRLSDRQMVPSA